MNTMNRVLDALDSIADFVGNFFRTAAIAVLAIAAIAGLFVVGVAINGLIGLLMTYPIMLLWNYVVPHVTGLPTIGFWDAWAIYMLSVFLRQVYVYHDDKKKGR